MKLLFISTNQFKYLPPMPLGLASVIGQVDESRHEIEVIDLMFADDPGAEVKAKLSAFGPDLIAFSIRNIDNQSRKNNEYFLPEAKQIVDICKSDSDAIVVIGGVAFTTVPEAMFDYMEPDYGIAGEGELVFAELVKRLDKKADCAGLPGLVWREGGRVRSNPYTFIEDLDSLRPPRRDLFDNQLYVEKGGTGTIVTKLGCTFNCMYCESPYFMGPRWRKKSPEIIADELESMEKDFGIKMATFADSIFNCPIDYTKDVCNAIIRRGLSINWFCLTTPAFADKDLFKLMKDAGCVLMSLGCDTGAERIFKAYNKGYTKQQLIGAAKMLEDISLNYALWFMLGAPGETKETVKETVELLRQRSPLMAGLRASIRIMPHTKLLDIAIAEGVVSADDTLMEPRFYISKEIDGWVEDYITELSEQNPKWVATI